MATLARRADSKCAAGRSRLNYQATGPDLTIVFTSDESAGADGFEGSYTCGTPRARPGGGGGACEDQIEVLNGPGACAQMIAQARPPPAAPEHAPSSAPIESGDWRDDACGRAQS